MKAAIVVCLVIALAASAEAAGGIRSLLQGPPPGPKNTIKVTNYGMDKVNFHIFYLEASTGRSKELIRDRIEPGELVEFDVPESIVYMYLSVGWTDGSMLFTHIFHTSDEVLHACTSYVCYGSKEWGYLEERCEKPTANKGIEFDDY